MSNGIFSDNPLENDNNQEVEVKFEDLVGEGRKYQDPDQLAKAYGHADAYIAALKAEKIRIEAENKVLKELDESRNKRNNDSGNESNRGSPNDDNSRKEDPPANNRPNEHNKNDDVNKDTSERIREELEKYEKEKTFSNNVNSVSEKLEKYYGNARDAQKAIHEKAKELSVSTDWLMDIAGRSPEAFFNTIGIDKQSVSTPSSQGDVNTAALKSNANRRNFKYYEEIRKTNPKHYYSPQIQKELMKDAREQGAAFYN